MLLKLKTNDHMVNVTNLTELINLNNTEVTGRLQEGEEQQDPERFRKDELVFLSGEKLPRCWTDPHYREGEFSH